MDEQYMKEALREAAAAAAAGEVPVGAVVVRNGQVIARGHNRRETEGMATAHAELLAIESACRALGSWRLEDCTLYVTLEPCPMCAGAAINARIGRVVYGAKDPRGGAMGSLLDVCAYPFYHRPAVVGGVEEKSCRELLQEFFKAKR